MPNTYVNKVQLADGSSIIDISDSTAVASDVKQGKYFYLASGQKVEGSSTGGSEDGSVWQDGNGYIHLSPDPGTHVEVDGLTVNSAGTYTAPTGHAYSPVTVPLGTAGTPSASKGTVSNHSVSVTPSVTNSTGWIAGGTKTGTAVTVSASELDSGTKSVTSNGTGIDVVGYAAVDVAVPTGSATLTTKTITANGTYNASSDNADGYSSVTVNVSGGGGEVTPKQINFIDYDGTVLHSYTSTEWANVTALPSNPTHTGLTAQGWNWSKNQIDAQLTAVPTGDIWIGQMYVTASGDTEIDVEFVDSSRSSPYFRCAVNGSISISWGDNTPAGTVTGSSLSSAVDTYHNYASAGNYTITIHVVSGSFAFFGTTNYSVLHNYASSADKNRVYSSCVKSVRLGNNASIKDYAFRNCSSLALITIPSAVGEIGISAFSNCYALASITIPSGVSSVNDTAFTECDSLKNISIPSSITSVSLSAFSSCRSLKSIGLPGGITAIGSNFLYQTYNLTSVVFPNNIQSIQNSACGYCYGLLSVIISEGITSIGSSAFSSCYAIPSLTIPSTVTDIGNSAFSNCYGVKEYHFKPTTPPTLGGSSVFSNIASDCIIYVPSASLNDYQTANYWSAQASKMQGE